MKNNDQELVDSEYQKEREYQKNHPIKYFFGGYRLAEKWRNLIFGKELIKTKQALSKYQNDYNTVSHSMVNLKNQISQLKEEKEKIRNELVKRNEEIERLKRDKFKQNKTKSVFKTLDTVNVYSLDDYMRSKKDFYLEIRSDKEEVYYARFTGTIIYAGQDEFLEIHCNSKHGFEYKHLRLDDYGRTWVAWTKMPSLSDMALW